MSIRTGSLGGAGFGPKLYGSAGASYFNGILNAYSGKSYDFRIANSSIATLNSTALALQNQTYLTFAGTSATISPSVKGVYPIAQGLYMNVPSGGYCGFAENGSGAFTLSSAGLGFYGNQTGLGSTVPHFAYSSGSNYLIYNVPTGVSHNLRVNGTGIYDIAAGIVTNNSTNGYNFLSSTGTITGANRQIAGTSGGLTFNTPTGTALIGSINGTQVYKFDGNNYSTGLSAGASLSGTFNSLYGYNAGINASTGSYLVALGAYAMGTGVVTGANYSVALGYQALQALTGGTANIAIGPFCGNMLTTPNNNICLGQNVMSGGASQPGDANISIGLNSSRYLGSSATFNVAIGPEAIGGSAPSPTGTVAVGYRAGLKIGAGSYNTILGYLASSNVTTGVSSGSYNIIIGANCEVPTATADRQINIGDCYKRDSSGNVTLNHGSTGTTLIYTTSSTGLTFPGGISLNNSTNVFKRNVTGATYANSSTTTVLTITTSAGRIQFFDNTGGGAMVRYDGTSCALETFSSDWVNSTTPAAGEIGIAVSGGNLNMYVGSAATRKVGWFIDNVIM